MKIYYRISDKGRRDGKPYFITLENCLRNFCKHFDANKITIIADNCEDTTIDMIKKYVNEEHIIRTSLNNCGAFLYAANKALAEGDDDEIVYLVEDDYLHIANSEKVLQEGFTYGDYVSLYDHPDKYTCFDDLPTPNPYTIHNGGEITKVLLTDSTHWKYTNSATMTFAIKIKTLREDIDIITKYCMDKIPHDFDMFYDLRKTKKRNLVTSIPGLSTHGQLPYLTPLINWEEVV